MSALKHHQEYIPPTHDYVPQHPDWQPSEGLFGKKKVKKMSREELEVELNKAKVNFEDDDSDDDLRKKVKQNRDTPNTARKMQKKIKKNGGKASAVITILRKII